MISSSEESSSSTMLAKRNRSSRILLISLSLFRCIYPRLNTMSFFLIFQLRLSPSEICKKALKSSGSLNGVFSSSHLEIVTSATPIINSLILDFWCLFLPYLSINSTSVIPIWLSRKLITEREMLSKISLTPCFIIYCFCLFHKFTNFKL